MSPYAANKPDWIRVKWFQENWKLKTNYSITARLGIRIRCKCIMKLNRVETMAKMGKLLPKQ